jgi:hypothetical protein
MSIQRVAVVNKIIEKSNITNPVYLEIGVWDGGTFQYVNSNNKDGVDPEQYCVSKFVNYKVTSDLFFERYITKKYDVIFIDGLHTAYQVSKDIYNSINNLNNGGWIILDDVYPHSKYEQERLNLRKSGPQTGDVWKALYHVLDKIQEISDEIYFTTQTERGSFVFKIKSNNKDNILIDSTIPTCNIDGFYDGNDAEWSKYDYDNDFNNYLEKLKPYLTLF